MADGAERKKELMFLQANSIKEGFIPKAFRHNVIDK
jgi:hypothetical protein